MSRGTTPKHDTAESATVPKARVAGLSLAIAAAMTMSACTATPATLATLATPAPPAGQLAAASASPTAQHPASVDPAVAATTAALESTLKSLVATNPKPDREALRAALVSAGIPKAAIEVSVSRTPTGLDVDAMEAAALSGESCVMGQIRDGGVVVTVLPVLATGKCFVGDAR